jgi:CheY-like chemotaxis protein
MDQPIKVLLIEDNATDARLLRLFLGESKTSQFDITHVVRLSEGMERLAKEHFDLIMSDLLLPDSQGIELKFAQRPRRTSRLLCSAVPTTTRWRSGPFGRGAGLPLAPH